MYFPWIIGFLSIAMVDAGCCGCGSRRPATCPSGWESNNEKCYKLVFPPSSTSTAIATKGICAAEGAHAASIQSQAENDWITDYTGRAFQAAGKSPSKQTIILGAHLQADGKSFAWEGSDGGADCPFAYTNWGPNEPSGGGWNSLLFELNAPNANWHGKWNDAWDTYQSDAAVLCVKAACGAPPNAAACDYKPQSPAQGSCGAGATQCGCLQGCRASQCGC